MSRPLVVLLFLALLIAAGGAAWWGLSPGKAAEAPSPPGRIQVEVGEVEREVVPRRFRAAGSIVARERLFLAAEQPGRVEAVVARDGARVEAGDVLVRFDDEAERSRVRAAEATLAEARAESTRAEPLVASGVLAKAVLEDRRAALSSAEARLAEAKRQLDDRRVRAPFAGVLGRIQVSPGEVLAPGDPIVELSTTGQLLARFALPVEVVDAVSTGTAVVVRLDEHDSDAAPIPGRVVLVEDTADPRDRLVECEAALEATPERLVVGSFVPVDVILEGSSPALLVPQSAIQWQGPQAYVYRVDAQDRARLVPVEIGPRHDERIVVRGEGLAEGERVVAIGLEKLRDGVRVSVASKPLARGAGDGGGATP